ncbi:MAG: response regulator [Lachnospiraceae bacterium]|nr:response regulator [Lachnospiraceae bacterium]
MIAICLDDEKILLKKLADIVRESPDITEVFTFDNENEALLWAKNNKFDIAFLDIQLHNLSGLDVAAKLLEINAMISVVFCTGYSEYALDAIDMHIDCGYLMKPIRPDRVQKEIDRIKFKRNNTKPVLDVKCFGSFEVFHDGKPVIFGRSKSKELFAYLVDRRGSSASSKEICAVLWEQEENEQNRLNYLYQIVATLKKDLASVGADMAFVSIRGNYSIDVRLLKCDYYDFLNGDSEAALRFTGEYMSRYSWAEPVCAWISDRLKNM